MSSVGLLICSLFPGKLFSLLPQNGVQSFNFATIVNKAVAGEAGFARQTRVGDPPYQRAKPKGGKISKCGIDNAFPVRNRTIFFSFNHDPYGSFFRSARRAILDELNQAAGRGYPDNGQAGKIQRIGE